MLQLKGDPHFSLLNKFGPPNVPVDRLILKVHKQLIIKNLLSPVGSQKKRRFTSFFSLADVIIHFGRVRHGKATLSGAVSLAVRHMMIAWVSSCIASLLFFVFVAIVFMILIESLSFSYHA